MREEMYNFDYTTKGGKIKSGITKGGIPKGRIRQFQIFNSLILIVQNND